MADTQERPGLRKESAMDKSTMTRVLYCTHPEADYQECFIYDGLRQMANVDVWLYPPKYSYWGQTHRYPSIYDPSKEGVTGPYDFFKMSQEHVVTLQDIQNCAGSFDLVIMSVREGAKQAARDIRSVGVKAKLVVVDGEDYSFIRTDVISEFGPTHYFKRELPKNHALNHGDTKIVPLPLSSYVWNSVYAAVLGDVFDCAKIYNVMCVVGNTHPYRDQVIAALKSANIPDSLIGTSGELRSGTREYLLRTAMSKIAVSIRGHGEDTVRRWEIPSFKTLHVADTLGIQIPDDYVDGRDIVTYTSPDDCVDKVLYYLSCADQAVSIAGGGFCHTALYHTTFARAHQLLSAIL